MLRLAVIIIFAFVLDILFGDPHWLPHPIRLIGNLISKSEKAVLHIFPDTNRGKLVGGAVMTIFVILVCFFLPFFILFGLRMVDVRLATVIEIFFCYQILAMKSLNTESMKVYPPLVENDLPKARTFLSYIVGRDTQELSATQVTKATIETVAENTCDGVIAPLIFMAIGGAPLAFAYKAINTLDSMIGYKNDRYLFLGRFAAKLDDITNYIPARISALLMIVSSFILALNGKNAIKIYRRDRKNHASPNSGQTESVCAGALDIQLAGDASYFGEIHHKPTIGDANREVVPKDIKTANRLMLMTSLICSCILVNIHLAIWFIFFQAMPLV